ncbi:MAG: ECF transporter S component [Clostridiales bacterium]|nr:ECF transporter S component [Clostridiales bacterium]
MNKEKTRKLVIAAMLGAITIVLGLTPLGFIPLGVMNATTMHIPVIIAAILEGPIVGAAVGLIFGVSSMVKAFTMPLPTSFVFWNPLIAVLPRVLIGIVSYYLYAAFSSRSPKFLKIASVLFDLLIIAFLGFVLFKIVTADKFVLSSFFATLGFLIAAFALLFVTLKLKFDNFALTVSAFFGSLTNSVLVLGGIYLFYATPFMEKLDKSPEAAGKVILGLALTSSLPEAIIAVIITIISVNAITRFKNR